VQKVQTEFSRRNEIPSRRETESAAAALFLLVFGQEVIDLAVTFVDAKSQRFALYEQASVHGGVWQGSLLPPVASIRLLGFRWRLELPVHHACADQKLIGEP
jgi:hypothetical protein